MLGNTSPDASTGLCLFTYLRSLPKSNGWHDRRDVIATVFRAVQNAAIEQCAVPTSSRFILSAASFHRPT